MAFTHGKAAVLYLGGITAAHSVTAYCDSIDCGFTDDVAEVSVFGTVQKPYVAGLRDGTMTIEGPWCSAAETIIAALRGTSAEFNYGPVGSASTSVRWTGSAICTNYSVRADLSGAVRFSATFQQNGSASLTTFA
jgi:hypothetical protein